ncbi:MAG: histidine phosphatase family protein [Roseobacter sp.]
MRRLILMRHAKSEWGEVGVSDHDRRLNDRGRASAKVLGGWMRRNQYHPDEVICSSAQRTGETYIGLALDPEPTVVFDRSLYLAPAHQMLKALKKATTQCVLMVAHNDGICDMAHRLLETRPQHERFSDYPTGATLVCDFKVDSWSKVNWHMGTVVDFVVPRELMRPK